jgi:ligand-binding SRPBCC domain-containing protein
MATHTLHSVQKIPASLQEVWDFFSNPGKLQVITPPYMKFKVISTEKTDHIYKGQIIEYKVRPLLGIPLYWMTEITEVIDKELFIDEQRKGPYRLWRHQHFFKTIPGGVEMTDMVEYQNPLGIIGRWGNWLFIKRQLKGIFDYRYKKVEEIFGKWPSEETEVRRPKSEDSPQIS